MWDCGAMIGMGGGAHWITTVLVWALLALGVVYLWRYLNLGSIRRGQGGAVSGAEDRALEILRERYAKGDIDGAEFDRLRRDLS